MIFSRSLIFVVLAIASAASAVETPLPADHAQRMSRGLDIFQKDVSALLKEQCLKCHGGEKTKGDFDLSTREDLLRGGKDGPAIIPFNAGGSSLLKMIRHEEEPFMPDKKPKLPDDVIGRIAEWIDNGAPYAEPLIAGKKPNKDRSVVTGEDKDWWAFRPLAKTEITKSKIQNPNPVDVLLMERSKEKGMKFNRPAAPRDLIRRAYLDLTGLPPPPEEVERFVQASGVNPKVALETLVSRLLDSPRYGERWARHWLDVARFAESSGFEHDYDRPFAYHYRDFVIKALNMDLPYDQFVRWQLAGDEFEPDNALALSATGFLGAGVFPTQITANEVERTRYDAMDDMLSTTGSAMLGITVGCARCHDHKYDPIPTRDYYRMLSTFTTTVRSNIEVEMEPEKTRALKATWDVERGRLSDAETEVENSLRSRFEQWIATGMNDAATDAWTLLKPTDLKSNSKSKFVPQDDGSYLVEGEPGANDVYTITTSAPQGPLTALKLEALADVSLKRRGPGRAPNGNFGLGRITMTVKPATGEEREVKISRAVADHEQNKGTLSVAASLDQDPGSGWAVDGQIGRDHAAAFYFDEPVHVAPDEKLVIKLAFTVNTQHSIGRPRFSVTGDPDPKLEGGVVGPKVAAAMQAARADGGATGLKEAELKALFDWWKQREPSWKDAHQRLADHLAKEPVSKTTLMICGEGYPPLVMHSQGAPFFEESYFLKRGNTDLKDGVAGQGFLQALMRPTDATTWEWSPPKAAKYSGRRRSLSNWMTDVENGSGVLLARVMVNRLWQHHLGRGIVSTPNDFGRQGSLPSQPELLDWLASEFIRNGWRLKPMHKLIMTSEAYQQGTERDPGKEANDPANDLFMRRMPQRLEGESIRDSMLGVSGMLDDTMFGPGTRDEGSRRRSIYFNMKRSQLMGSMVAFDAPEPLTSQGVRPVTTVAPQALMLMNSPQVRTWAEALARRVEAECSGNAEAAAKIGRVYALCLGREPRDEETKAGSAFIRRQEQGYASDGRSDGARLAFADFCQVLFGLNEFVYQP